MNNRKISIILGTVCLFLTIAIVIQIRTISSTITISDPTFVDDELRDEVLRWKERYTEAYKQLEKSEIELEKQRAKATENDTTSTEKENELKTLGAILGTTEVSGKGVIITLKDNNQAVSTETLGTTEDLSTSIVHAEDIMSVVNELKNAGAEAISVNDQRIVSTSSFKCIGNVIRINGERVGAPFTIKAIGKQEDLYNALIRRGGYLFWLDSWGVITDVKKPATNFTITKYNGAFKSKYMKMIG